MKINFKTLELAGFGSYITPTSIDLDNRGLIVITGVNGAGKSSFVGAIYWCLYNKNLKGGSVKDVVTWKEFRPKEWLGTRVITTFEIDDTIYSVANHIGWKGAETFGMRISDGMIVSVNGNVVGDFYHKADIANFVCQSLGIPSQVFLNAVIFPQRAARLLQCTDAEQKAVLESFYSVEWVDKCQKTASEQYAETEKEITTKTHMLEKLTMQLEHCRRELQLELEHTDKLADLKKEQLAGLTQQLKDAAIILEANTHLYNSKLHEAAISVVFPNTETPQNFTQLPIALEAINSYLTPINTQLLDTRSLYQKCSLDIQKINASISERQAFLQHKCESELADLATKTVSTACYVCGSPLSEDIIVKERAKISDRIVALELLRESTIKQLAELSALLKEREAELSALSYTGTKLSETVNEWQMTIQSATNSWNGILAEQIRDKAAIDAGVVQQSKLKAQIDLVEAEISTMSTQNTQKLEELSKSIQTQEQTLQTLSSTQKEMQDTLAGLKWWKDIGFTRKGVKAYIMANIIDTFNQKVRSYLNPLGYSFKIILNLQASSKSFTSEISKGTVKADYESMSGGEKQRIDIAVLFAMHDTLRRYADINMLVLDEITESLDEEGCNFVFTMLTNIKLKSCASIFVITHNEYVENTSNAEIVKLVKLNNSTTWQ